MNGVNLGKLVLLSGSQFPLCAMKEWAKVTLVPFSSNFLYFILSLLESKINVIFIESSFFQLWVLP